MDALREQVQANLSQTYDYLSNLDKETVLSSLKSLKDNKAFLASVGTGVAFYGSLVLLRSFIQGGFYDRMATMTTTNLSGKTVLITGGNSGIGLETAKQFARMNGNVIITVRSDEKGKHATAEIAQSLPNTKPSGSVSYYILDTSDLNSTNNFIDKLMSDITKTDLTIDYFVFNAGIVKLGRNKATTKDGLQRMFQTNYYGHWVIGYKLNSYMIECGKKRMEQNVTNALTTKEAYIAKYGAPIRCVLLSSGVFETTAYGLYDPKMLSAVKKDKSLLDSDKYFERVSKKECEYSDSKLLPIYYMQGFQRNLEVRNDGTDNLVWFSSVGPGAVRSAMFDEFWNNPDTPFYAKAFFRLCYPMIHFLTRSPDVGCQVILHCCGSNDQGIKGSFWKNCMKKYPKDALGQDIYAQIRQTQHLFDSSKALYESVTNEKLE